MAVRNLFICGIDAGGSCDVLFGVIMTYPIDLDWNSSCGTVLGIVLLKMYATTGSSTPNARLKSLVLATGVTYRNNSPTISRAELTSNAAQDASQVSQRQSLPSNDYSSRHEAKLHHFTQMQS